MVAKNMSALLFALILVLLVQRNSEGVPVSDNDGVPSVFPQSISGNVSVSALQAELAAPECHNKSRDIIGAILKDIKGLSGDLKNIPLVPHLVNGLTEATTFIICGAEDALSDVISGAHDLPNILTKLLVDLVELKGTPVSDIPAGVINITEVITNLVYKAVHDLAANVGEGVDDLVLEVKSGVVEVVNDVAGVVSGVETDVVHVVNAVDGAVQLIGSDVANGVGNVVHGVDGAVQKVGGDVAHGVKNLVHGVAHGLGGVIHLL